MLPSPPLTVPDVQISCVRFFTGDLRSQRLSGGRSGLLVEGVALEEGVEPSPWDSAPAPRQPLLPDPCNLVGVLPAKSAKVARYAVVGIVAPITTDCLGSLLVRLSSKRPLC